MFSIRSSAEPDAIKRRCAWAGLTAGFAGSWLVEPAGPDRPLRIRNRELPVLCPVRRLTGHRCPGCGMTRGLVYLFRLKPHDAIKANPLAPIALALLVVAALDGVKGRPRSEIRLEM